jgi:hypothetical protein
MALTMVGSGVTTVPVRSIASLGASVTREDAAR